jgi:hypothetical protein
MDFSYYCEKRVHSKGREALYDHRNGGKRSGAG